VSAGMPPAPSGQSSRARVRQQPSTAAPREPRVQRVRSSAPRRTEGPGTLRITSRQWGFALSEGSPAAVLGLPARKAAPGRLKGARKAPLGRVTRPLRLARGRSEAAGSLGRGCRGGDRPQAARFVGGGGRARAVRPPQTAQASHGAAKKAYMLGLSRCLVERGRVADGNPAYGAFALQPGAIPYSRLCSTLISRMPKPPRSPPFSPAPSTVIRSRRGFAP
jgi:hypothetical protein